MPADDKQGTGRGKRGRSKKLIAWIEFSNSEARSRITLDDGTVLDRCYHCQVMWEDRNERGVIGGPECEGCKVDLLPENHEAAEVYMMSRRQYVTRSRGMEGDVVIDISIPAIKATMDALGVENQRGCLVKVQRVFHHFLAERNG